jgi:hypothetical protein
LHAQYPLRVPHLGLFPDVEGTGNWTNRDHHVTGVQGWVLVKGCPACRIFGMKRDSTPQRGWVPVNVQD